MIHPDISHSRFVIGNLTWYALLIVIGIAIAVFLAIKEEQRKGLPKDYILDVALLAVPLGVIGARLYYVAFQWSNYSQHPMEIFAIWEGGLAIYGGIIGGFFAVLIMSRLRKQSLAKSVDCLVPGLVLAQAIGRWGNFFNREAYGRLILSSDFQFFPIAVYIPEQGYFMATFFYEFLWNLLVFIVLWSWRKDNLRDGDTTLQYFGLYACGRTFIEGLRSDSLYWYNIRVSQWLSILAIAVVLSIMLVRYMRRQRLQAYFYAVTPLFLLAVFSIMLEVELLAIVSIGVFMALVVLLSYHAYSKLASIIALLAMALVFIHRYELALLFFMIAISLTLLALFKGERA